MESKGFPKQWEPGEYPTYFEKIFGDDRKRQSEYLTAILSEKKVRLSVGCRVLAALMHLAKADVVFTTNFDTVVEKAMAEVTGSSLMAYHLEGAQAAKTALNNRQFPFYCKLHGDFRFESIKNLPADLASQNDELSSCFVTAGNQYGFVVAGYSGRDESVMSLFASVLSTHNPFPHGLFWTGLKGTKPSPEVAKLLDLCKSKGVAAEFVEIETYDTFMLRIWKNLDTRPKEFDEKVRRRQVSTVNISLPESGTRLPLFRMNALPITVAPTKCSQVLFRDVKTWKDVKDAQRKSDTDLILTRADEVLAWGSTDEIRDTFPDATDIKPRDLPPVDQWNDNLNILRFVEEGLCAALVRNRPLLTRRTRTTAFIIVDPHTDDRSAFEGLEAEVGKSAGVLTGMFSEATEFHPVSKQMAWAEGLRVSVDVRNGRLWALVTPDIWIWPHHARHQAAVWMQRRRNDRLNQKHNDIMDAWIKLLFDTDAKNSELKITAFDDGADYENPAFALSNRTAYSLGA